MMEPEMLMYYREIKRALPDLADDQVVAMAIAMTYNRTFTALVEAIREIPEAMYRVNK